MTEADMQQAEIPSSSTIDGTSNAMDINEVSTLVQRKDRGICFIATLFVSILLCIVFIYSSTVQTNDSNGTRWLVFYAFHAIIPAVFIIDVFFCFPHILIYAFGTMMALWSIVFLVISSLEVSKSQSQDYDGDNNINQSQQSVFDLAGSILTLISAIYHMVRIRFQKQNATSDIESHNVMS
jgi:hypothetical protein